MEHIGGTAPVGVSGLHSRYFPYFAEYLSLPADGKNNKTHRGFIIKIQIISGLVNSEYKKNLTFL